jgi:hypothetical protein
MSGQHSRSEAILGIALVSQIGQFTLFDAVNAARNSRFSAVFGRNGRIRKAFLIRTARVCPRGTML